MAATDPVKDEVAETGDESVLPLEVTEALPVKTVVGEDIESDSSDADPVAEAEEVKVDEGMAVELTSALVERVEDVSDVAVVEDEVVVLLVLFSKAVNEEVTLVLFVKLLVDTVLESVELVESDDDVETMTLTFGAPAAAMRIAFRSLRASLNDPASLLIT